jgi:hypothetical protein
MHQLKKFHMIPFNSGLAWFGFTENAMCVLNVKQCKNRLIIWSSEIYQQHERGGGGLKAAANLVVSRYTNEHDSHVVEVEALENRSCVAGRSG